LLIVSEASGSLEEIPKEGGKVRDFAQPAAAVDPEVAAVLEAELARQRGTLEMIASENFVPRAVLEAQGSVLTNKYAEGYPGRRYYGGCEEVDKVETLAIERAKSLFNAEYANVQPHSGAQANAAVYHALLSHGDTVMGLQLAHGGHLLPQPAGHRAAQGCPRTEMRRLKRQDLAAFGQSRFDFGQRRTCFGGDDQLVGIVGGNTAVDAGIEDGGRTHRFAVKILAASAPHGQCAPFFGSLPDLLLQILQ